MSILFVGKRFYTNRDALRECFGRIYQLPKHWSHAGIDTDLWLVDYHTRDIVRERHDTLAVTSLPALSIATMREWLSLAFRQKKMPPPGTIIASGDCYIGLMAYWLARRLRARFIFDVYDKYDEFAGYRRLPGLDPYPFLLKRADRRLFASHALMEQVGPNPERDVIVPNGIDTRRFRPMDMQESRHILGLPAEKIFIGYFGSMEPDRGVGDLVDAVGLLRQSGMDIELLLGGKPHVDFDLQRPGIRYVGNVPFAKMPLMLASCNLLALPYRRSPFMDAGSSNKIAETLACARPMVATRTPNFLSNFPDQAAQLSSVLANPSDPADMAKAIRAQLEKRIVASFPSEMDWSSITSSVACKLGLSSRMQPT